MNGEPLPELIAHLLAVEVRQRFSSVDIEVVEYEVDGRCFRVVHRQLADHLGELGPRTARGGKGKMLARFRLDRTEDIRCAAPFIFVVTPCFAARCNWRRLPHIGVQRDWLFVQSDYRFRRIVGLFIGLQDILHVADVVFIQFRHAPHFFPATA
jgi:hypothetical protein